jgi:HK97 family phage portal protein
MDHGVFSSFLKWVTNGNRNYQSQLTDPTDKSLIMAVLLWIARRWPEAPMYLERNMGKKDEAIYEHPLLAKLKRPNAYYSGNTLWFGVILSLVWDGNGYIVKVRKGDLSITELWYVPHFLIEPKVYNGSTNFIDFYEYTPGGKVPVKIMPEDIIHFRYGIDPFNPRKGLAPLKSIARDAATDEEADLFAVSLLKNMGVPGLLFTPDFTAGQVAQFNPDEVKKYLKDNFTGEHRGEPLVAKGPTKVEQFGFDPKKMDLATLRAIPEERVCAVTGIPAAVVGFGSGLAQTKVGATMRELREMAYEDGIIPLQRIVGPEIQTQLLDDFEPRPDEWTVKFDLSQVRVLQEDQNNLHKRISDDFNNGILYLDEARTELGFETSKDQHIRRVPFSVTEEQAKTAILESEEGEINPTDIQQTALNGAQVDALTTLASQVAEGMLPLDTARAIAEAAFPTISQELLSSIFSGLESFEPTIQPQPANIGEKTRGIKSISRIDRAYYQAQLRAYDHLRVAYSNDLVDGFEVLGSKIIEAYDLYMSSNQLRGNLNAEKKAIEEFTAQELMDFVVSAQSIIAIAEASGSLANTLNWQGQYLAVAKATLNNINAVFGLKLNLTDPVQREILAKGGRHFDLVGVNKQTQEAIYKALAEARSEGLGPREVARLIRSNVEGAGMYPGVYQEAYDRAIARGWSEDKAANAGNRAARQYRAEVISRTETKYAQNMSSMEISKGSGTFNAMMVFDGIYGEPRSGAVDVSANGQIVSFEDAQLVIDDEHPQGTLSLTPVIAEPGEIEAPILGR